MAIKTSNGRHRIVVTGGPGGGKTTAADLFRREIGDSIVVVPETATLLFNGGFPRSENVDAIRASQVAIYHVQTNNENVHSALYPHRTLLCDRGTVDGAAYWPDGCESYFEYIDSTFEDELKRYDAVIFFETAAVGGMSIEGGNPARIEGQQKAIELDRMLRQYWSQHPNFSFVPHNRSFIKKINNGLECLQYALNRLNEKS